MSSRVQKGSTVFRPVVKARSRAPTVPPSQSSSGPSDLPIVPEATPILQATLSRADSLPIPSTAVPGRESSTQPLPSHSELASIVPQSQENVVNGTPIPAHGMNFPGLQIPSHSPPVLMNTSNLPPTLINVGRSMTEPISVISMSSRQDDRPPMIFPHPFNLPPGLPIMTPEHSQQSPVIFTPSGPTPAEFTNTLVPTHSFDGPQQPLTSENATQHLPPGDSTEKPKRKRRASKVNSDGEGENDSFNRTPKSRSTTPHQRRSRGPSLPPFDPNADPGEDIDPTVVTMATLCNDTGQGRVSSKAAEILTSHAAWKTRNRERRIRMRAAMEAKKYGRQVDDDTEERPANSLGDAESSSATNAGPSTSGSGTDEQTGIDYSQQMETSRYNVQVRIGPNGETIIDEESLVVDRTENEDTSNYTHVVESDHTKFVNSGTYGKRYRGSRWSAEETELFYHALSQYGENYELIAYVLPGRDRKSCKNKFKAEDKKNHSRINYCLNNRIPVDMKTLERMTGKDFSGPVPEIRAPPPPVIQHEPSREQENVDENNSHTTPTKQVKKRSRSRTVGVPEEGVVIVGDVDSVLL
ncbi:hypothetical protein D9756_005999 [Leucocoprinus leucothites]|uniref:Myb-like domain-containing protein n=1 Tax=Leucocoprinus leucothites TaxID=201217 RepID=A0A8H5FXR2_9AGAR|nr:hypothetical protein D9756_005999 [Leucoagaricus leucothites]